MSRDLRVLAVLIAAAFLSAPMALAKAPAPTAAAEVQGEPATPEPAAESAASRASRAEAQAEAPVDADLPGFGGLSFASDGEPIVVEADRMEFDYEKNQLIYRGSVHVTQGDLELTSKQLHVTFDRAGEMESAQLQKVVARGDVEITQGERTASGDRAIFDQTSRQIVLVGDPVLRDGPNEVQGDRLTVYLDEGRSVVESSPKKRVSAVLFPGSADGDAEAEGGVPEGFEPAGDEGE